MHTDLFLALLDRENPRGHPVLAALLYAFCPAAAGWWLAGIDPLPRFDPHWQVLVDRSAGHTLKSALIQRGFEGLLDEARSYIQRVDDYRLRQGTLLAPKRCLTLHGIDIAFEKRFRHSHALEAIGGEWANFFEYLRAWVYHSPRWEETIGANNAETWSLASLQVRISSAHPTAVFPAWSLGKQGDALPAFGLLTTQTADGDLLRIDLLLRGVNAKIARAQPAPEIWRLDRETGEARLARACLSDAELAGWIDRLAVLARQGPYLPLGVFHNRNACRECGFRNVCYNDRGEPDWPRLEKVGGVRS